MIIIENGPHWGSSLLRVIWYSPSVSDTPLVSMVKDTNGSTVWSDGPRNKYDPGFLHNSTSDQIA